MKPLKMQYRIVLCLCSLAAIAPAQQSLWLDEEISAALAPGRSLVFQFHQRRNDGGTSPFAYFFHAGIALVPLPWLTVIPSYRYYRHPGNPIGHENRLLLNLTLSKSSGRW